MSAAYVTAVVATAIAAVILVTHWIEVGKAQIAERNEAALADQAADWSEPTRAEVEAGYMPTTDAEADDAFAELLAPFGLTPAEVAERYRRSQQAERMDRIRDQINSNVVARFQRELEDWDGGDVA